MKHLTWPQAPWKQGQNTRVFIILVKTSPACLVNLMSCRKAFLSTWAPDTAMLSATRAAPQPWPVLPKPRSWRMTTSCMGVKSWGRGRQQNMLDFPQQRSSCLGSPKYQTLGQYLQCTQPDHLWFLLGSNKGSKQWAERFCALKSLIVFRK